MELIEDRRLLTLDTVPWVSVGPDSIIDSVFVETTAPPVPGANHAASGAINVASPRPKDANTFFVGAVNGGIWKTAFVLASER